VRQDLAHLIEKKKVSELESWTRSMLGPGPKKNASIFKKCVLAARAVFGIRRDRADGGGKRF
jgi:hypothetical protein